MAKAILHAPRRPIPRAIGYVMFDDWFVTGDAVIATALPYSYEIWLVLLSCVIAVFGSYTAFHLFARMNAAVSPVSRNLWLGTGAAAMGCGIWSMHFVAMLAVRMPGEAHYGVALTALSIVFAVVASGFAFYFVGKGLKNVAWLDAGGVVLGAGIGAMPYTGMAAMRMDARVGYDPLLFAVSIVIAVLLSYIALRILFNDSAMPRSANFARHAANASLMGLSIAAVHYTAMAATYFVPTQTQHPPGLELDTPLLGSAVVAVAVVVIAIALAASLVDQLLAAKDARLRQSEEILNTIFERAADGIITIDEKGLILSFNPVAEEIFGYSGAEAISQNVSMLMAPDERAQHDVYLSKSDRYASRIIDLERDVVGQRKDGTSFPLELAVSGMVIDGKRMFMGILRDASERIRAEETLRDAMREAELASRAKSEFLANMSHELRTPLNAIIGFSEIIASATFGPVGSPKYREYAKDINDSGLHLLAVITDILDLSKIEAGKLELHEETVHIAGTVDACLKLVSERALSAGLTLVTDIAQGLPPMRADERKLKQILINLLSNAVKFTPAGGTVTTRVWHRPGDGFVFQVADTGIGIAAENIPNVLSAFGQVDSTFARKVDGTGLGLPLTKSLVELHGGSLNLQSELGAGTTVTVRFPAERLATEAATGT